MASGLFLCLIIGLFFGRSPPFKQRPVFALTRSATGGLPVPQTLWDVLSIAAPGQGVGDGRLIAARHLAGTLRSRLGRHSRPLSSSLRRWTLL